MITATRNWFNRNRTRFAVGAGIIGAGYLTAQYTFGKINEARRRMSDDRIARENLRRRFAQNQEDCTYTVLALLPTATDHILHELPVEDITAELQARKSEKLSRSAATSEFAPSDIASTAGDVNSDNASTAGIRSTVQIVNDPDSGQVTQQPEHFLPSSRTKLQLWDELKITSIVRAFTLIYTLALLTLLTRIQLNLLGRRNYLSSVVSLASPSQEGAQKISLENRDDDSANQAYGSDFDTNRKYLTFSWWLLHKGWKDIKTSVEAAVKDVFGPLTPRDSLTFEKLSELVLATRKRVEGATEEERRHQKWLQYLLPSRQSEEAVLRESGVLHSYTPAADLSSSDNEVAITQSLRRLLDETSDLVDSPTFTHVLTLILDSGFSLLVDEKLATQAFKLPPQGRPDHFVESDPTDPLGAVRERIVELTDDGRDISKQTQSKLATVLAILTRQAHSIGAGALIDAAGITMSGATEQSFRDSNEYLQAMEEVRDLEGFAAVVYSSNFEFEGVDVNDDALPENVESDLNESATDQSSSYIHVEAHAASTHFESAWDQASSKRGAS